MTSKPNGSHHIGYKTGAAPEKIPTPRWIKDIRHAGYRHYPNNVAGELIRPGQKSRFTALTHTYRPDTFPCPRFSARPNTPSPPLLCSVAYNHDSSTALEYNYDFSPAAPRHPMPFRSFHRAPCLLQPCTIKAMVRSTVSIPPSFLATPQTAPLYIRAAPPCP